jgi:hypothetical protein
MFAVTKPRQMVIYGHLRLSLFNGLPVNFPGPSRVGLPVSVLGACGKPIAIPLAQGGHMFRITTCSDSGMTRFVVEGKLAGACVGELEKCWQAARSVASQGSILVDLSSVTFVDASGKQLLMRMHEQGTEFLAAGLMTKFLIEEIKSAESISPCRK